VGEENARLFMVEIHFRPMVLSDVEQVHALDQASFTLPWPERSFRYEVTQNNNAILWVAEVSDEGRAPSIAGMIVIWLVIDEAHIGTIAVHPDYRRHGIARRLLARTLLESKSRGAHRAFLEVRRSNLAAQALYREFGFLEVGVRPRYYQDNREDALLLTLDRLEADTLEAFATMEVKL
jgi:ribosomal-protein-alanine N-acetyltransferase